MPRDGGRVLPAGWRRKLTLTGQQMCSLDGFHFQKFLENPHFSDPRATVRGTDLLNIVWAKNGSK